MVLVKHSWYWLRLMVDDQCSWITHIREGRVLPVCGIFFLYILTLGIDKDSWYWQRPWYWIRLTVNNQCSWTTHIKEGQVLHVCMIFSPLHMKYFILYKTGSLLSKIVLVLNMTVNGLNITAFVLIITVFVPSLTEFSLKMFVFPIKKNLLYFSYCRTPDSPKSGNAL